MHISFLFVLFLVLSISTRKSAVASGMLCSDYICILGQKLDPNGLSVNTKLRIVEGVKCWESLRSTGRHAVKFILTGGVTSTHTNMSEASAMKDELVRCLQDRCMKLAIDENIEGCILLEEHAANTIENAVNCLPIITAETRGSKILPTVHVVTSDYHIFRSSCIFKHVFAYKAAFVSRPAPSVYKRQKQPRSLERRPSSLQQWYLSELFEIEVNGTKSLHTTVQRYGLTDIPKIEVERTLFDIKTFIKKEGRSKCGCRYRVWAFASLLSVLSLLFGGRKHALNLGETILNLNSKWLGL